MLLLAVVHNVLGPDPLDPTIRTEVDPILQSITVNVVFAIFFSPEDFPGKKCHATL